MDPEGNQGLTSHKVFTKLPKSQSDEVEEMNKLKSEVKGSGC